jgi:hypothetical protein
MQSFGIRNGHDGDGLDIHVRTGLKPDHRWYIDGTMSQIGMKQHIVDPSARSGWRRNIWWHSVSLAVGVQQFIMQSIRKSATKFKAPDKRRRALVVRERIPLFE